MSLVGPASLLPPEIWDSIIDIIAGAENCRTSLIRLSRVCRLFRPRALAKLLSELYFSHDATHIANPYALLDIFDAFPGYYVELPRKAELGCVEFFGRTLANRTMRLLPQLSRLEDLTLCDLQLSREDLPEIEQWRFDSVTRLVLKNGDYDDVALDAFLGRFPQLRSLSLSTSVICVAGRAASAPLPFTGCHLHIALGGAFDDPVHGSMQWALAQRAHFVLETLDFEPSKMPAKAMVHRLNRFSRDLRTLHVRIGDSPDHLGHCVQAIQHCRALTALEIHGGRLRDIWHVLFGAQAQLQGLARVACRPTFYNPARDAQGLRDLADLLDELKIPQWQIAHHQQQLEASES